MGVNVTVNNPVVTVTVRQVPSTAVNHMCPQGNTVVSSPGVSLAVQNTEPPNVNYQSGGPPGPPGPQGDPGGAGEDSWVDYCGGLLTNQETIAGGTVLTYLYKGVTIYRHITDAVDVYGYPNEDAFYETFSGGILSDLIVLRGV